MIGWITAHDLKHKPRNKAERELPSNAEDKPLEPGWDIFSSTQARDLFLDLESKVVIGKEYVAGYSLIFYTMKDSKRGYPIKESVSQKTFCDFLERERHQQPIVPPKLKKVDPIRKRPIVNECVKVYLEAISSNT